MSHDHEHTSRRDVIVTDGGGRGAGYVLAVIVAILGVLLVVWLFLNLGNGEAGSGDVIPDEVNVDVDSGGGGGSDGGDTGGG